MMRTDFLFYSLVLHGLLALLIWLIPLVKIVNSDLTELEIFSDAKYFEDSEDIKKFQELAKDPLSQLRKDVHVLSEKALRFQKQTQKLMPQKDTMIKMGQLESKYLPDQRLHIGPKDPKPKLFSKSDPNDFAVPIAPSIHSEIAQNLPMGQMLEIFPNVAQADFALLNTDPIRYMGFYKRMNELIANPWSRRISSVIYRTYPNNFTDVTINKWTTFVELILLPDGRILDVVMLKQSGQNGFDQSAVQTLKETLVIPNPPKSLLSEDGLFHLKISFNVYVEPKILAAKDQKQTSQKTTR